MDVRALRFHGPADLRLETVTLPPPAAGEVVARVDACGVCGSDLRFLDGSVRAGAVPVTLGHEVAATVSDPGDSSWERGAAVLVATGAGCGQCRLCQTGRPNLCGRRRMIGVDRDGGMADALVVPSASLIARPTGIEPGVGAVAMDAGVAAYHAVARRGGVAAGDAVAVFGAGALGSFAVQIAKLLGAAPVVAVDSDPAALARAAALGADETVPAGGAVPPGRAVKLLTDGGVDVAVEFVGSAATLDAAIKSLRPGGVAVAVGVGDERLATLPNVLWAIHEYELRGSFGGLPGDAATVLGWLADGALASPHLEPVPLAEAAERITARARGDEPNRDRLVVVP